MFVEEVLGSLTAVSVEVSYDDYKTSNLYLDAFERKRILIT